MTNFFVNIDVILAIFELKTVVLHTPIYEFVPFLRIESFDELLTFFLSNYVVENIETWYGSSVSSFCIREVYN